MAFTWQSAEELATAHLRVMGFFDACLTRAGADGGVDVIGDCLAAQVKHHARPVGAPDVQRLRGAAHRTQSVAFYSSSGYTAAGIQTAEETGIALFRFSEFGEVFPVNALAAEWCARRGKVAAVETLIATTLVRIDRLKAVQVLIAPRLEELGDGASALQAGAEELLASSPSDEEVAALGVRFVEYQRVMPKIKDVREAQQTSKASMAALSDLLASVQLDSVSALAAFDLVQAGNRLADFEKSAAVYEELVRELAGVSDGEFAVLLARMQSSL